MIDVFSVGQRVKRRTMGMGEFPGTVVEVKHDPMQIIAPATYTVKWDDGTTEPGITAGYLEAIAMKTEIDIDDWNDAIGGKSNNPVGDDEIKRMSEDGELIVKGHGGEKYIPKKDDGKWTLTPE